MAAKSSLNPLFHRASLAEQTAEALKVAIAAKKIPEVLPAERVLAQELRVCRPTLRQALAILRSEGVIEKQQGRPSRISSRHYEEGVIKQVVLVSGELQGNTRLRDNSFIQAVVSELKMEGIPASDLVDSHFGKGSAERVLEKVIRPAPGMAWGLFGVTPEVQKWFQDRKLPVCVLGSCHPDISLPSFNQDYPALGRHAAAQFFRFGHRNLLVTLPLIMRAGDQEALLGFQSVFKGEADAVVTLMPGEENPRTWAEALKRRLQADPAPTALFCMEDEQVLMALIQIAFLRKQVGKNISLIGRQDMPLYRLISPQVASYSMNSTQLARRIARAFNQLCEGIRLPPRPMRLMPDFLPGETLSEIDRPQ